MSTNLIRKGNNLELNGGVLNIFGSKGFVQGKNWVMNILFGSFVEISPDPLSHDIESVINTDIASGNSDKIHHVQVSPATALCLYLEGRLVRGDIVAAEETENSVTFKDIKFNTIEGDKTYDLIVIPDSEYAFATVDKNGEIV